jgi:sulfur relay (sulfurtransferase) complex TusBCD TusD component (DsrE family)
MKSNWIKTCALLGGLLLGLTAQAAPIVSLSSPTEGQNYVAAATVTLAVDVAPAIGTTIKSVEYYRGTTRISRVTAAPYAYTWNNVAAGTYSLTAKATDSTGAATTSAARNITVKANQLPTVALTAPAAGQSYVAPATITLAADASDSDGSITKVDFYRGSTLIGTATSAPYTAAWNNAGTGTYSLTARATDDKGGVTTSAARSITVKANQAPTVALTAPTAGQTFIVPEAISLAADAADTDGTIAKVDFYRSSTLIGTATSAPYTITWNDAATGTYSLTAKATDDKGSTTTSASRSITVKTAPPTVSLTSPTDGQNYIAAATINLTVDVTPASGTAIKSVEYYRSTTRIASVTAAPYAYTWNNVAAGTYSLTVKVTDDKGGTTTSAARSITVKANQAPTVALTAPAEGQNFATLADIMIAADAADTDGSIVKVDFFRGTTLIGTVTSAPYSILWSNAAAGTYSVTAKATDDRGATTTSAARSITVKAGQAPSVAQEIYYIHADHLNTPRLIPTNRIWLSGGTRP